MNPGFQQLYRQLLGDEIDTSQFLSRLKTVRNYEDDLLAALKEQYDLQEWRNVSRLLWAVSSVPDQRFSEVLCNLLDHHRYDGYMEALADALSEIADEKTVPAITRALDHRVNGDSGRHFNRALLNALFRIGSPRAIESIKHAQRSSDELVREHAADFIDRLK